MIIIKNEEITVKGARANNLKNINVTIPRDKLTVFTGLSGSGKSSLAFDTIYAEGQRRYMESLSSYARMFLGQMEKPDVDSIDGLSPAIAIDQKTTSRNPRSTVGTVTEIYDYLRLLYSRVSVPHCPNCGKEIHSQTIDQMVDNIMSMPSGTKISLLSPVVRGRKGEYAKLFENLKKNGYTRVRVDGEVYSLDDDITLEKYQIHHIEVIVDRLIINENVASRLTASLETVLQLSSGVAIVLLGTGEEMLFSETYSCVDCGISLPESIPRLFSFNNPLGACAKCSGLGKVMLFDKDYFAARLSHRSLSEFGLAMFLIYNEKERQSVINALEKKYNFSSLFNFYDYPDEIKDIILLGSGKDKITYIDGYGKSVTESFPGLISIFEERYKRKLDGHFEVYPIEYYMTEKQCTSCHGRRLNKNALAFTIGGLDIMSFTELSVKDALAFLDTIELSHEKSLIAAPILKELRGRLTFLVNVGLEYLTLLRSSATLSGGETQRIRLATQIGAGLAGVLYIFDEPSIGLHQRDNHKLLSALKGLRDIGNTLIVVEHDEETIREADYIVDVGPGAGVNGGNIVACGCVEDIIKSPESITGKYLSGELSISVPEKRRQGNGKFLSIYGAKLNNLKNIDVSFPLGEFICVTGVSGSGKSSLVNYILAKCFTIDESGQSYRKIEGIENIDKIINIDQSPIGRTPRSNPATYIGLFNEIRELFAKVPESRARGYKGGRFSFNVSGGRCEACKGDGIKKIEMHFLPDVYVPCEVCKGQRYNRETLEIKFKDKNIYEVLDMTVEKAVDFFADIPSVRRKINILNEVGLGYIKLGQSSTLLSGGEAQRIKLADELSKVATGNTMYLLDEPTTGLHSHDVNKLLDILQRLVNTGNTVIVIEHNLDVIKNADYIIDLGPEGGDKGGNLVYAGTPEQLNLCERSYTGQFLNKYLRMES